MSIRPNVHICQQSIGVQKVDSADEQQLLSLEDTSLPMRTRNFITLVLLLWALFSYPVAHANQPQGLTLSSILDEASAMAQTPSGVYRFDVMMDLAVVKAKLRDRQEAVAIFHRGIEEIMTLYPLEDRGSTRGSMAIAHLLYIAIRQRHGGLVEESQQLVTKALQKAQDISDPETRYYTYDDIAVAQLKVGDQEGAQRTLQVMFANVPLLKGEKQFEPSYRKMKSVLRLAETHLELQQIEQARMKVNNAFHIFEKLSIPPNDNFFSTPFFWDSLAVMAWRVGDSVAAQRTLEQIYAALDIGGRVTNIETALRIAQALIEGNQHEVAIKFVDKGRDLALELKWEPHNSFEAYNYVSAWKQLAITKAMLGDVKGALEAEAHIPPGQGRIGKGFYQKMAYVAAGNFDAAFRIVKAEEPVDYHHLLAIVHGQAKQKKVAAAIEAFEFLKERVSTDEGLMKLKADSNTTEQPPDYLKALRAVAVVRGVSGNVAQAVAWARSLETPGEKAHALLGVAEGLLAQRNQAP